MLNLHYQISFNDLKSKNGIDKINKIFMSELKKDYPKLHKYLIDQQNTYTKFQESYGNENEDLLALAKYIEDFILKLFYTNNAYLNNYQKQLDTLSASNIIFLFRKLFLNKYVKLIVAADIVHYDFDNIKNQFFKILNIDEFNQDLIAKNVLTWLEYPTANQHLLDIAKIFSYFMLYNEQVRSNYPHQTLYFKARKIDFNNLFPTQLKGNSYSAHTKNIKIKSEFTFYNKSNSQHAINESNYCIKCHGRHKDSCKVGLKEPLNTNTHIYQKNPLNQSLKGCPLSMHISQMHQLYESHNIIASAVVITINNPLFPTLGANICNACENACIFQKQQPVDTPSVETTILDHILELNFGFEIYYLLTQWNPLRFYRPTPKRKTKNNILIVGAGPAGYSLAYSLHNEGHNIVMIDGLKIEPLNQIMDYTQPIKNIRDYFQDIQNRIILGFGGVSEYGITSRWNKNYLLLIAIIIYRQKYCKLYDNLHFGSSINLHDALKLNFNHIALCVGAGKPKILKIDNTLAGGVRTSSEFLMSLHMGAYKYDNVLNLQIQLPAVIIGGGLTAMDCACEYITQYFTQITKLYNQYQHILNNMDSHTITKYFKTKAELDLFHTYIKHYHAYQQALKEDKLKEFVKSLGGIKIIYHKSLLQSKAYTNNYKEIQSALHMGVEFIENMDVVAFNTDENNNIKSITCFNKKTNLNEDILAKNVIIATGTSPNNIPLSSHMDVFDDSEINLINITPKGNENLFTTYKNTPYSPILKELPQLSISNFGDMHHIFAGSVVGAMASSFHGYHIINNSLIKIKHTTTYTPYNALIKKFNKYFTSHVLGITPLKQNTNLIEITFKSPYLSDKIKPGNIFKIQSYETNIIDTTKHMSTLSKPVVLGHISNNNKTKTIKALMLNNGASTKLIANLANEYKEYHHKIAISGVFGSPSINLENKNILIIGSSIGSYSLIPILENFKKHNNKIITMLGYKNPEDSVYKHMFIKHSDHSIFSFENMDVKQNQIKVRKKELHNTILQGNILNAISYFINNPTYFSFNFNQIDKILISSSSNTMDIIKQFLIKQLQLNQHISTIDSNTKTPQIYGTIPSPMMCTMKGICGMCLQKQIINNQEHYIYCCKNNEHNLLITDLSHTNTKLGNNSVVATIAKLYMDLK